MEKEEKNFAVSGALNKEIKTDEKTGTEMKYIEPEVPHSKGFSHSLRRLWKIVNMLIYLIW